MKMLRIFSLILALALVIGTTIVMCDDDQITYNAWKIDPNGDILPRADSTYDIGGVGLEVNEIHVDTIRMAEKFEVNPLTSKVAGGAAGGTTGDENVMSFGFNTFEYHILGTQTIVACSLYANETRVGLSIEMDETANDGVEIGRGITKESPSAFVVGTSAAFYAICQLYASDVSGTDDCVFGFRKAEAYQGNVDDYDELAGLNMISGDIKIETILNGGDTTTTDTTDNWADGAAHTLEVYVSAAGVVTYKIDGAAPTTTAAFTFDDAEVVVPFLYFLHDTDICEGILLERWECGLQ